MIAASQRKVTCKTAARAARPGGNFVVHAAVNAEVGAGRVDRLLKIADDAEALVLGLAA